MQCSFYYEKRCSVIQRPPKWGHFLWKLRFFLASVYKVWRWKFWFHVKIKWRWMLPYSISLFEGKKYVCLTSLCNFLNCTKPDIGPWNILSSILKGLQAYGRFSTPDPGSGDYCAAQNLHKIQVGAKNSQALVFSVGLFISQPSALRTSFFSLTSQKSSHRGTLRHL